METRFNKVIEFESAFAMNEWFKQTGPISPWNPIQIQKVYRSADGMYFIWYTETVQKKEK